MDQNRKGAATEQAAKNGSARHKPTETLPTERVAASKQFDILRAYAIASGPSNKGVQVSDAAAIVKMAPATVSICSAFFKEVGFLAKTSDGRFAPAPEVIDFARAYEWSPSTAASKLAPLLANAWFGERLLPKVTFSPMPEDDAIADLATASGAAPVYRPNLLVLLDMMEMSGLIVREGGQVRSGSVRTTDSPGAGPTDVPAQPGPETREPIRDPSPRLATGFSQQEGVVQFHVSVKVNMAEFAGWRPERITSFFAGIAQVLAAKGNVEEDAGAATN